MQQTLEMNRSVRTVRQDRSQRPFLVIWEATRACALACVHCRAEAIPRRDPRELTTSQAEDLMDQILSFGKPAPIFVITGGDPFERPDLVELVRYGRSIGLAVAVSPSGTRALNRESLGHLRDAGMNALSLSIDGSDATSHDAFRGVPGTFDQTMAGWHHARELGIKVQVNTTITAQNAGELPEIAALVRGTGAMTWSAFLLVTTGRGSKLKAPSAADTEDILNFLYDVGQTVPTRTTEGHHFRRVTIQRDALAADQRDHVAALGLGPLYRYLNRRAVELRLTDPTRSRRAPLMVSSGNGFLFISHTGDVQPSGFLPVTAGNVRDSPLPQIYQTSSLFTKLRNPAALGGRCGECEFATVCGGSRSRAYATTGDFMAEDPACGYQPGSFEAAGWG